MLVRSRDYYSSTGVSTGVKIYICRLIFFYGKKSNEAAKRGRQIFKETI